MESAEIFNVDDDEELPNFRSIPCAEKETLRERDLKNLGVVERMNLVERLVKVNVEDHENFLFNLKQRYHRVGLDIPTIEVRFEHVTVEAKIYAGSRRLPTLYNDMVNSIEGLLSRARILPGCKKPLTILKDVSGIIKPGRLTLLLGPPSSGKTTFLQSLSGKVDPELKVSGKVTYNGHEMNEFVPQRTSAYISQYDVHIPYMTVRETLAFSATCQGVGSRYEMLVELLRREHATEIKPDADMDTYMKAAAEGNDVRIVTDYIIKILGLEDCADTLVGNDMIRGISGGQRKRLTIGEMMVGPARAFFMDEISTGLDSSTSFRILNLIRQSIHILQGTAVVSLLQPSPETFNLFDDIILLSNGTIVYHGPRQNVLQFFEYVGFQCPTTKALADFLHQMSSRKDQEQYWNNKEKTYQYISVTELLESFRSFDIGRKLADELIVPFNKKHSHSFALTTRKYGVNMRRLLKACVSREYLLMNRHLFLYIFKQIQFITMGVVTMTLLLRVELHKNTVIDGRIFMGALFYALTSSMYNTLPEVSLTTSNLPVFYKQRDLLFFPAWAYSFPQLILKLPLTFCYSFIWVGLTYYTIGYDPEPKRFFKQILLLILFNQMASGMYRLIGALGRNIVVAHTFASCVSLTITALGGFVLSRDSVGKWRRWIFWISPFIYGQNGLAVNEFLGKSWSHVPQNSTQSLGLQVLKFQGFLPEAYWYWIGIGALLGYVLLFNFLVILALTYLNPYRRKLQVILSEQEMVEGILIEDGEPSIGYVDPNKKSGMILPFEPHSITFEDICYAVDMPQEMKALGVQEEKLEILKGVNGAFRPGVLTALMGMSGAGKTTLLDVLSGRKTRGYTSGTIKISGYPKKQETFARVSGYCEQIDIHSPHVTVYESLLFSAWLRLPLQVDAETRQMFIEEVMKLIELTPLRESLVGMPGVSGLSTEQRKRLTIAVELVSNPSIIFMDEPTSGLDARAAAIVMRTLRSIVDAGRTVVCTIHQPSFHIFHSFDELLLLKGGEEIYFGPIGKHSCDLISYFEGIEGVPKIRDGYNPSTWILDITSTPKELQFGLDFMTIYKHSDLFRRNKTVIKEFGEPTPNSKDLHFMTSYSQSLWTQCVACLWKHTLSYWRNPPYSASRFLFTIVIAIILGTLFFDVGSKRRKQQDVLDAAGSMFVAAIFLGAQNGTSVQPQVTVERTIFYRERASRLFSPLPYAFGQVMAEVPYILMQTIMYGVIVYGMIKFEWKIEKFLWYLFFVFFTLLYCTLFGMTTASATPNEQTAGLISSVMLTIWVLFSGFIVPKTRIPIWWRWYYYLSPFGWTLNGLVSSQFGDVQSKLENNQTVEEFVKSYFGFRHDSVGYVGAIVVGIAVVFGIGFGFSITKFNFQKR